MRFLSFFYKPIFSSISQVNKINNNPSSQPKNFISCLV
ncbi:hypothetical Protein psc1_03920 [Candidatus Phytoplasma solani]